MTTALSSKPAVACPLRDGRLVEPKPTCTECPYCADYTEYFYPREGVVVYCDFDSEVPYHYKAYIKMRRAAQDEAMKQLHEDEGKRLKGAIAA